MSEEYYRPTGKAWEQTACTAARCTWTTAPYLLPQPDWAKAAAALHIMRGHPEIYEALSGVPAAQRLAQLAPFSACGCPARDGCDGRHAAARDN